MPGPELLARMDQQLRELGVFVLHAEVSALARDGDTFLARHAGGAIRAERVILATGIVDKQMPLADWVLAVRQGLLRYCPVCDAYEAIGRKIAVIGPPDQAAAKALFMRTYSADVTLLPVDDGGAGGYAVCHGNDLATLQKLASAGVRVTAPIRQLKKAEQAIEATLADGACEAFQVVYPAMGAAARSDLAVQLSAAHTPEGFLTVDAKQRTNVDHLFGIGDVVTDLHQISVAFGHAAVAACALHHSLPPHYAEMPARPG
jgi:thioredoxin reductase (NADPH)